MLEGVPTFWQQKRPEALEAASVPTLIDLEPEGKVYVIIDLSGSSGEGIQIKPGPFQSNIPFLQLTGLFALEN
ncbi:hypothetical protein STEG23_027832 [Scotinomys teguina]